MTVTPYLLRMAVTAAADTKATASYTVPRNEKLHIRGLIQMSTGAFGIADIRTTEGHHMTNASEAEYIHDNFIQAADSDTYGLRDWPIPLDVTGGMTLYIDVKDLSSDTNTIVFMLYGEREF